MDLAKIKLQFSNDIISLWVELNNELSQLILINSEISAFSRKVINLAVSINHFPEKLGLKPKDIFKQSRAYKIISDVCDASKHGDLKDSSRNNHINISAVFEGNNKGKFKFRRNKININHTTFGKIDFMKIASEAINYLIEKLDLKLDWDSSINLFRGEFIDKCILWVFKRHHIQIEAKGNPLPNSWAVEFVRENSQGKLEHFDPPEAIICFREKI